MIFHFYRKYVTSWLVTNIKSIRICKQPSTTFPFDLKGSFPIYTRQMPLPASLGPNLRLYPLYVVKQNSSFQIFVVGSKLLLPEWQMTRWWLYDYVTKTIFVVDQNSSSSPSDKLLVFFPQISRPCSPPVWQMMWGGGGHGPWWAIKEKSQIQIQIQIKYKALQYDKWCGGWGQYGPWWAIKYKLCTICTSSWIANVS